MFSGSAQSVYATQSTRYHIKPGVTVNIHHKKSSAPTAGTTNADHAITRTDSNTNCEHETELPDPTPHMIRNTLLFILYLGTGLIVGITALIVLGISFQTSPDIILSSTTLTLVTIAALVATFNVAFPITTYSILPRKLNRPSPLTKNEAIVLGAVAILSPVIYFPVMGSSHPLVVLSGGILYLVLLLFVGLSPVAIMIDRTPNSTPGLDHQH